MSFDQAVKYLYDLQPIGIKFGLKNTLSLLSYFQSPHEKMKTIHVAGTNGKGSVCSMLSAVLQAAGFKVGLYTSPHLRDFTERISVNGHQIERSEVIRLTQKIQEAIREGDFQSGHPTFFEVVTVMALVYFAEQQVDLAVMEVGMGGRLDATNVIQPLLGIITTIDMDHQDYLGKSLLEIAGEKAGIIKRGMPVIVGASQPEILKFFQKICQEREAAFIPVYPLSKVRLLGRDLQGQRFELINPGLLPQQYFITLLGQHQIQNALLALTAIQQLHELLPHRIPDHQIAEGLAEARWPGRIEIYHGQPPIIVDGAHNPAAAYQLSQFLKDMEFSELILVMGIMRDKDIGGICRELVPLASRIILTRPEMARAAKPEEILRILLFRSLLIENSERVHLVEGVSEAVTLAKTLARSNDLICITGSLYTAGEAKAILDAG
ncbi:MAG: bifunctional folylpolyglutamate synthase/dihydrofolate synthase [bacterium]